MKSPVNIAKESYSKILKIDELTHQLEKIHAEELNIKETQNQTTEKLLTLEKTLQTIQQTIQQNLDLQNKNISYATSLLKYTHDITKIPKAQGFEKVLQEGNFILYKEITKILDSKKIKFFLDFGILIGIARHNNFIPWDDDIDISVPRQYYELLPSIFDNVFKNTGLFYKQSEIIRIYYQNTPLQLDIFPIDFYDKNLNKEGKQILKQKVINYNSIIKFNWEKLFLQESVIVSPTLKEIRKHYYHEVCDKDITAEQANKIKSTIIHSPESPRYERTYILDYNDIFPLRKIKFLDIQVPIPNNIHTLLEKYYGDYFAFPSDIDQKHKDIESRINTFTIMKIEEIIQNNKII
ncbi:LicD family protein [Candidatus Saccharibacteria bacterium]|nr:LicD family protein [Candidatus Saccharibacteria bacterium]